MDINNPAGLVKAYAGASAPAGFLLCDGASYLRADYPDLFTAIGTLWGSADGTHFNVPDLRGRFARGKDTGDGDYDTVGKTGGVKTIDLSHTHAGTAHTHSASITSDGNSGNLSISNGANVGHALTSHTHSMTITLDSATPGASDSQLSSTQSIMNPYLVANFIIKI